MQGAAAQGLKVFRPEEATGHEIVRLAVEGTKIERLARGEVTEIAEVRGETTFLDLMRKAKEEMTDEELERHRESRLKKEVRNATGEKHE
jgi:hypothetical protein